MKTGWISSLTFLNNRKKCQPILGTHRLQVAGCRVQVAGQDRCLSNQAFRLLFVVYCLLFMLLSC